jgi:hypothetical protein
MPEDSVAVRLGENDAGLVIPERKARARVPGGKNEQTLSGNLQILEAFQPQMAAIRVLDHDVVGGLNHRKNGSSQGAIPPVC